MKVVSIPARLGWAACALALSIPLAGYETIVAVRAPWWRLPLPTLGGVMGLVAIIVLPPTVWILRGRRWVAPVVECIGGVWCLATLWAVMKFREPALGFLSVAVLAYWLVLSIWIRRELSRSFFDPRMSWFEGLPKAIPGLECRVLTEASRQDLRVSRIDDEGLFVFTDKPPAATMRKGDCQSLVLQFRDRQVKASALPVVSLESGSGFGLRFAGMSADERKTLGDFVEILRGEGHA